MKISSYKKIGLLVLASAAVAACVFVLVPKAKQTFASGSNNNTSVLSGSGHCSDGSSNCGTYYHVETDLSCNTQTGTCSNVSASNSGYTPVEPNTFTSSVGVSSVGGNCSNSPFAPTNYSGSIFGTSIPSSGGTVTGGAPSNGLSASMTVTEGSCANYGGNASGWYNITGCDAGYTASDDYCTKNVTCNINSFSCDSNNTLSWSTSNCSNVSISPSIGGSLPTSGSNAHTSAGTYSLSANNGAVGPATATCLGTNLLQCSESNSTISAGSSDTFTAINGSGSGYSWQVAGGSPSTGSGTSFTPTFNSSGPYTVNLTDSASNSAFCSVTVTAPVCGGNPSVSGTYGYSHNAQTSNWDSTAGIYAGNYLIISGSNFGASNAATVSGIPGAGVSASVASQINVSLGSSTGSYTATIGNGNGACSTTQTGVTISSDNAACGSDNGQNLYSAPTNLCSGSTPSYASAVTTTGGANPAWSWTCNSLYGGTNASCSANQKVDGGWGAGRLQCNLWRRHANPVLQ